MNGDDALVPPSTAHCPLTLTATPVTGSPTLLTSTISRPLHPTLGIHLAGLFCRVHQLVEPCHTLSVQPRWLSAAHREVPPTMTRYLEFGSASPYPMSPDAKRMRCPGWSKYWA